jgi:hypothetical protein
MSLHLDSSQAQGTWKKEQEVNNPTKRFWKQLNGERKKLNKVVPMQQCIESLFEFTHH